LKIIEKISALAHPSHQHANRNNEQQQRDALSDEGDGKRSKT